MTSSNGHHGYDEDLLASAPAPTKGMVQSGYATDLLVDKPKPSRRGDIEAGRHRSHSSRHASVPNGVKATDAKGASTTSIPTKVPSKTPFYRTKRGLIILVIVAIVLLVAIIGGAVGGALAHKNKNIDPSQGLQGTADSNPHSTSSTPESGAQVGVPQTGNGGGGGVSTVRVTTTVPPSGITPAPTALGATPVSPPPFTGFTFT